MELVFLDIGDISENIEFLNTSILRGLDISRVNYIPYVPQKNQTYIPPFRILFSRVLADVKI